MNALFVFIIELIISWIFFEILNFFGAGIGSIIQIISILICNGIALLYFSSDPENSKSFLIVTIIWGWVLGAIIILNLF